MRDLRTSGDNTAAAAVVVVGPVTRVCGCVREVAAAGGCAAFDLFSVLTSQERTVERELDFHTN